MDAGERRDIYIGLAAIAALGGLILLARASSGSSAGTDTTASPVVLNNATGGSVPVYDIPTSSNAGAGTGSGLRATLPAAGYNSTGGNVNVTGGNTILDIPVAPGINIKLPAIITNPLPSLNLPGTNITIGGDSIIGSSPTFNYTAAGAPSGGAGGGGGCGCSDAGSAAQAFLGPSDLEGAQAIAMNGSQYTTNLLSATALSAANFSAGSFQAAG